MGYTKIPNWLLDMHNDIDPAPFRVLCCIYRDTQGFHRSTYKIKISKLIEMSGVNGISRCFKILKEKGFIEYEYISGTSNVITIKPIKSVTGLQNKAMKSVNSTDKLSEPNQLNELMGFRGAKENYKENLKKDLLFLEFKKKYPANKFDDDTSFDAWQSLTDADKQLVVGVMEYQNNKWDNPNFDRTYIHKASNYLFKRKFLDDDVKKHYDDKLGREREAITRREYLQEANKHSASDEEKKAILSNWKKTK